MEDLTTTLESIEEEESSLTWTLFIKQLNGERMLVPDINPESCIFDFKSKVEALTNIEIERQRMIFRGKVLENGKLLSYYNITNHSCIHLLKRAQVNDTTTSNPNTTVQRNAPSGGDNQWNFDTRDLSSLINNQIGMNWTGGRTPRRLGLPFAVGDNIEHIYQGLATLDTLDSHFQQRATRRRQVSTQNEPSNPLQDLLLCLDNDALAPEHQLNINGRFTEESIEEKVSSVTGVNAYFEQTNENSTQSNELRSFQVGQWIDCLDTVNQWLEATVTHVSEDKRTVRVHYNGWGTRWDESIDVSSPRLARFRTKSKNKAQCRNFSPTLNHWVNHTPTLNSSNNLQQVTKAVYQSCTPILEQLKRITNDEYGFCTTFDEAKAAKREDILEMAPKLDILGRAFADLARSFANRPNFKRRQDHLSQANQLLQLVRLPLLPFGLKTNLERDRKISGEWNRAEHSELLRRLEYDEQLVKLSHGHHIVHQQRPRQPNNMEIHLHTIVTSEVRQGSNREEGRSTQGQLSQTAETADMTGSGVDQDDSDPAGEIDS